MEAEELRKVSSSVQSLDWEMGKGSFTGGPSGYLDNDRDMYPRRGRTASPYLQDGWGGPERQRRDSRARFGDDDQYAPRSNSRRDYLDYGDDRQTDRSKARYPEEDDDDDALLYDKEARGQTNWQKEPPAELSMKDGDLVEVEVLAK